MCVNVASNISETIVSESNITCSTVLDEIIVNESNLDNLSNLSDEFFEEDIVLENESIHDESCEEIEQDIEFCWDDLEQFE